MSLRSTLMRETATTLSSGLRKWELFWLFPEKSTIHTYVGRPRDRDCALDEEHPPPTTEATMAIEVIKSKVHNRADGRYGYFARLEKRLIEVAVLCECTKR
jgi:hypothetical protein